MACSARTDGVFCRLYAKFELMEVYFKDRSPIEVPPMVLDHLVLPGLGKQE